MAKLCVNPPHSIVFPNVIPGAENSSRKGILRQYTKHIFRGSTYSSFLFSNNELLVGSEPHTFWITRAYMELTLREKKTTQIASSHDV
jgi:hypothetical protein